MPNRFDAIVVGAGAAGLMAATQAAKRGVKVALLDKNARCARKVMITGKGRCNVTNNCTPTEFIEHIPTNPRFLYSAIHAFTPQDTMAFLEGHGVPLKTERGARVFPQSDKAVDIVDALVLAAKKSGVCFALGHEVSSLRIEEGRVLGVVCQNGGEFLAPQVLVCTGGLSYPLTGSTGDGYRFAKEAGHTIVPCEPSLVGIDVLESMDCAQMEGLALKNVVLKAFNRDSKKVLFEDMGEMVFTSRGVSGPLVLSLSSHLKKTSLLSTAMEIDLKPALDDATLDARIQRDFGEFINRDFANALSKLLPKSLIPVMVSRLKMNPKAKVNQITREQRLALVGQIKHFALSPKAFGPIEGAIVTAGGVNVKEIDPKTMQSKLVKGLYFAGEVLDVDGYTGGFNLQIAFSTGFLAGTHFTKREEMK